jgi:hypothetical protein
MSKSAWKHRFKITKGFCAPTSNATNPRGPVPALRSQFVDPLRCQTPRRTRGRTDHQPLPSRFNFHRRHGLLGLREGHRTQSRDGWMACCQSTSTTPLKKCGSNTIIKKSTAPPLKNASVHWDMKFPVEGLRSWYKENREIVFSLTRVCSC